MDRLAKNTRIEVIHFGDKKKQKLELLSYCKIIQGKSLLYFYFINKTLISMIYLDFMKNQSVGSL